MRHVSSTLLLAPIIIILLVFSASLLLEKAINHLFWAKSISLRSHGY